MSPSRLTVTCRSSPSSVRFLVMPAQKHLGRESKNSQIQAWRGKGQGKRPNLSTHPPTTQVSEGGEGEGEGEMGEKGRG